MEKSDESGLITALGAYFGRGNCDAENLVSPKELPAFEKYDEYVPAELLRKAYAADRLNTKEAVKRIDDMREAHFNEQD